MNLAWAPTTVETYCARYTRGASQKLLAAWDGEWAGAGATGQARSSLIVWCGLTVPQYWGPPSLQVPQSLYIILREAFGGIQILWCNIIGAVWLWDVWTRVLLHDQGRREVHTAG